MDWLRFFILSAYATSLVGVALSSAAALYFLRKVRASGPREAVLADVGVLP
jgi:hypothetical protein